MNSPVLTRSYIANLHEERLRAKWSVCTLEPPWFDWRPTCSYSCFLSHYKVEAAMPSGYFQPEIYVA